MSFGLVSFPIRLMAAARAETVHFHMLHRKDLSRIKEVWYCAAEDQPVERSEIVKGYEYSKGEYVVLDEEDLKKIAPATARTMEIVQFVRAAEVDPLYLEKSYYVAPEEAVTKPYALLCKAMSETGYDAVAKVSMHGREHIVILRPTGEGIVLHTMFYEDELHRANKSDAPGKGQFTGKEMDLAKRLISTLAGPFKPGAYQDEYRKNVERLIEQKQKGQAVTAVKQPKVSTVVNIIEALKKSLEQMPRAAAAAPTVKKAVKKRAGRAA